MDPVGAVTHIPPDLQGPHLDLGAVFRIAAEASPDSIMVLKAVRGADGRIEDFVWLFANAASRRLVGGLTDEFVGKRLREVAPGTVPEGIFDAYCRVVETGDPWQSEFEYRRDGIAVDLRLTAVKVDDGFAITFTDLNHRREIERRAEQSAERLELALEAAGAGVWWIDLATGAFDADPRARAIHGIGPREPLDRMRAGDVVYAEDRERVEAAMRRAERGEGTYSEVFRIVRENDGATRWVHSTAQRRVRNGREELVGITADVTDEALTARRLEEQTHRLRLALAAGQMTSWDYEVATGRLTITDNSAGVFVVPRGPAVTTLEESLSVVHPDDKPDLLAAIQRAIETCGSYTCTYRSLREGRAPVWLEDRATAISGADGKTERLIGISMDVSARKEAEEARTRQQALAEHLVGLMPSFAALIRGSDLRYLYANPAYRGISGGREVADRTIEEVWPDLMPAFGELCSRVLESGVPYESTDEPWRVRSEAGYDLRYFSWSLHRVRLPGEGTPCLLVTGFETTERVAAERLVRDQDLRYRILTENNPMGILHGTAEGGVLWANQAYCEITGYSLDDFVSGRAGWESITPEEWIPLDREKVAEAQREGFCRPYEKEYLRPDGSRVPVLVGYAMFGERREQSIAYIIDLSDLKAAEQRVDLAQEATRAGFFEWDLTAGTVKLTGMLRGLVSGGAGEVSFEDWKRVAEPESLEAALAHFEGVFARREPETTFELKVRRESGDSLWLQGYARIQYDEAGQPVRMAGMDYDITERKEAEEELRRSEVRFRTLFESMDQGFCVLEAVFDASGQPIDFVVHETNPAFERHTGLHEVSERSVSKVLDTRDAAWTEAVARVIRTGVSRRLLRRTEALGGRWFDFNVFPFRLGGPNHVAVLFSDVSERVQAEQELRRLSQREAFLAHAVDHSAQPFGSALADGTVLSVNRAFLDLVGYTEEEIHRISWSADLTPPEWAEAEADALARLNKTRQPEIYQKEFVRKDGTRVPVELRAHLAIDPDGRDYYYAFVTDISERLRAEQALKDSEARLQAALRASQAGTWDLDLRTMQSTWSDSHFQLLGLEPTPDRTVSVEVWRNAVHPDDLADTIGEYERAIRSGDLYRSTYRIQRYDTGGTIWVRAIGEFVKDADGRPVRFRGAFQDITDLQRAEDEARSTHDLLQTVYSGIEAGITVSEVLDGGRAFRFLIANRTACRWTAIAAEHWVGRTPVELLGRQEGEAVEANYRRAVESGVPIEYEELRRFQGADFWALTTVSPVRDHAGQIRHVVVTSVDITQRKAVEQALKTSEDRFRTMADGLPAAIWVHDSEGRQRYVNRNFEEYFGVPSEATQGDEWKVLMHPEDGPIYAHAFETAVRDQKPFHGIVRVKRGDGTWRWFESHGRPQFDDEGGYLGHVGGSFDVTEQQLSAIALRESEERLRLALEAGRQGTWSYDPIRNRIDSDARTRELWGRGVDEPLSFEDFVEGVLPDDRPRVLAEIESAANPSGDGHFVSEYRIVNRQTGAVVWVVAIAQVLFEGEQAVRWIGTVQDITSQKEAENALRNSEERYRAFVANSAEGVYRLEFQPPIDTSLPTADQLEELFDSARFAECNDAFARMYGYSGAGQVVGQSLALMLPPDRPETRGYLERIVESGYRVTDVESVECTQDGRMVTLLNSVVGVIEEGKLVGAWGIQRDITERRRAEEELRESAERLNALSEASPSFIWVASSDGRTEFISRSWTEATGLSAEETGVGLPRVIHPDDLETLTTAWDEARRLKKSFECEFRLFLRPVGEYRWHSSRSVPQFDEHGEVRQWLGVTSDIHDRKTVEQTLERLVRERTAELRASNQELESFSYSVSHDLRTPARAVMGTAKILLHDYGDLLPEDAKDKLYRQVDASKRMGQLIDDLLQLSRIGRAEISREAFELSELASQVAADVAARAEQTVAFRVAPGLRAYGDARLVRLVLQNLFENAAKFGGTSVEVGKRATEHGLAFFVADNGIGFDPQFSEKIFEAFQRLHRDTEYQGTGIGLANARRIIERHGGRIWADSAEGRGATFFFTLPTETGELGSPKD